jgi:GTP-binding protein YchF
MSLSIGIVGLPNVGKSTLFNALTKNDALAANYPFATIEPNTGIVPIPDERLEKLARLFEPKPPVVPAVVRFVDIAGLVAGAHKGEGLGNQFLSHIREVDAIVMVVRAFSKDDVQHVEATIDPKRDIEIITTELILADLQTVAKRLPALEKEAKQNSNLAPAAVQLKAIHETLNNGQVPARPDDLEPEIQSLNLLSLKPIIYVFNVDEVDLTDVGKQKQLNTFITQGKALFINAQMEAELKDLPANQAEELLASVGISQPGLDKLVAAAYSTLGLQSFLTAGSKEIRAWTVAAHVAAPQAAGVIHTDFARGFIAADVVKFDDLMAAGSWANARAQGKVRTEGKTYQMQPDDVVEFKFNV